VTSGTVAVRWNVCLRVDWLSGISNRSYVSRRSSC